MSFFRSTGNVILHAGLHKTGSTWLQRDVFPQWKSITYIGDGSLRNISHICANESNLKDKPIVMSSEAALGFPGKRQVFDKKIMENMIKFYQFDKIFIVKREFDEWVLSLYFQYLHEGGTLSLKKFVKKWKNLKLWENIDKQLQDVCEDCGVEIKIFDYEKMQSNPHLFVGDIADFIDVRPPENIKIEYQNKSRRGNLNVLFARFLNNFFDTEQKRNRKRRFIMQHSDFAEIIEYLSWKKFGPNDIRKLKF